MCSAQRRSTVIGSGTTGDGENGETAILTIKAWDQTVAADADQRGDASTYSATGAFSANSDTVEITVASVNDAPTLQGVTHTVTGPDEDSTRTYTVSAVAGWIDDVDTGALKGIAIYEATGNGVWEYSLDGGLTWVEFGGANADASVTGVSLGSALLLSAESSDNRMVRYTGDGDNGETATLTIKAWDQTVAADGDQRGDASTYSATGAFSANSDTVEVSVAAINDAPAMSAPSSVTVNEDASTVIAGISVGDVDVDAGTGEVQVTLSVEHGTLTLTQTTGLTFDSGSNGSAGMTVSGVLDDVNAALSTLTYTPFANYHGADSVQATVNDLGNFGPPGALEDTAAIALTVTDVIDYTPLYDDLSTESPTSSAFAGTAGPEPHLGNVFSLLDAKGLLPEDLTSRESGGRGTSTMTHLQSLLFESLFGKDVDQRNHAWDDLFSLIDHEKHSTQGEIWLGLEAFMAKIKEWTVGKEMEDIRLVFNADQVELAEWFDSITVDGVPDGKPETDLVTVDGYSEHTVHGKALVFNLDEMRVVDMLLGNPMNSLFAAAVEANSDASVSRLYGLDDVSLMDLLAS